MLPAHFLQVRGDQVDNNLISCVTALRFEFSQRLGVRRFLAYLLAEQIANVDTLEVEVLRELQGHLLGLRPRWAHEEDKLLYMGLTWGVMLRWLRRRCTGRLGEAVDHELHWVLGLLYAQLVNHILKEIVNLL